MIYFEWALWFSNQVMDTRQYASGLFVTSGIYCNHQYPSSSLIIPAYISPWWMVPTWHLFQALSNHSPSPYWIQAFTIMGKGKKRKEKLSLGLKTSPINPNYPKEHFNETWNLRCLSAKWRGRKPYPSSWSSTAGNVSSEYGQRWFKMVEGSRKRLPAHWGMCFYPNTPAAATAAYFKRSHVTQKKNHFANAF